jgi:hypothetical protein
VVEVEETASSEVAQNLWARPQGREMLGLLMVEAEVEESQLMQPTVLVGLGQQV